MLAVQSNTNYQLQLFEVCNAIMKETSTTTSPVVEAILGRKEQADEANFAKELIELRGFYRRTNPRYYSQVTRLQRMNPDWAVINFLKTTPASHLDVEKLKGLFELTSKVYLAVNRALGIDPDLTEEVSLELSRSLYDILTQAEILEAKQQVTTSWLASISIGALVAAAAATFGLWIAPLGFALGSPFGYMLRTVTAGQPALLDRTRAKPLQWIKINDFVRYAFEPASSGRFGRYIMKYPSSTLGEVEIDMQGEQQLLHFNLNAKHRLNPLDIEKLDMAMVRRLNNGKLDITTALKIIDALDKNPIPRERGYETCPAFLDDKLKMCLDRLKLRIQEVAKELSLKALSVKKLVPHITDVPTYKNGCGLYALALGAIRAAMHAGRDATSLIPSNILAWRDEWLTTPVKDKDTLKQLHTLLRQEAEKGLKNSREFDEWQMSNFISVCYQVLTSDNYPIEMQALVLGNEAFMNVLKVIADPKLYRPTIEETKKFQEHFTSTLTDITPDEVFAMQQRLQTVNFNGSSFEDTFSTIYLDTADPVLRIIKQRKLFQTTWEVIPRLEHRRWWCDEANKWLEKRVSEVLVRKSETERVYLIKLFGHLLAANFTGLGQDPTFPITELIEARILHFIVSDKVRLEWRQLYANYIAYLKEPKNRYMLTAEELGQIAKQWGLGFAIHEYSGQAEGTLAVTLTNPKKNHYQLVEFKPEETLIK